jgi:hypothetical protein
MSILICLVLAYVAAVASFWIVIAVWDPWAEYRELQSGLKARGK